MIETLEENVKRCSINPMDLKHLKIEFLNSSYSVALIDLSGNSILNGYGKSIEEAINDLHQGLL